MGSAEAISNAAAAMLPAAGLYGGTRLLFVASPYARLATVAGGLAMYNESANAAGYGMLSAALPSDPLSTSMYGLYGAYNILGTTAAPYVARVLAAAPYVAAGVAVGGTVASAATWAATQTANLGAQLEGLKHTASELGIDHNAGSGRMAQAQTLSLLDMDAPLTGQTQTQLLSEISDYKAAIAQHELLSSVVATDGKLNLMDLPMQQTTARNSENAGHNSAASNVAAASPRPTMMSANTAAPAIIRPITVDPEAAMPLATIFPKPDNISRL